MTAEPAAAAQRPDRARRVWLVVAGALACIGALAGSLAGSLVGANGGAAVAQAAAADGAGTGDAETVPTTAPRPVAQPSWRELGETQREILQPFASQWNSLSPSEKRSWLALAERLPRMDAEARQRARQRIGQWAELTPEQRRIARMNYRLASQLTPEERKAHWERYATLTSEQQRVLRTSGWTSNTAARHAGARTGLAKEAAQPLAPFRPGKARAPVQAATGP